MQEVSEYYRYCPDQPKVLISDAVCLGRRRGRYPQCPGCRFNDDQQGTAPASQRAAVPSTAAITEVFKDHQVRAAYPEVLDEEVAWRIGHATASYLRSALRGLDRSDQVATAVVVGRDMRRSSPALCAAFVEGARSTGANVVDVGMIDTPQLYFAINHVGSCGGVQTTASHLSGGYNGFKIAGQHGRPVGPETGLTDIGRIAHNMVKHDTGQQGALRSLDLTGEYRAFVRSQLQAPRPMKIVADASNGMAGKWVPIVFGDLPGVDLILLNAEHEGDFVHDPDPLVEENVGQVREEVARVGADLGICFDGDADKVALVDEAGQIVGNDILTALLARQFLARSPGSTIVYDLRCSRVVDEEIKAAGGVPRRERVGGAFIKKALTESKGAFGGGPCGHFYFKDNFYCDSGLLTLAHVINMLTEQARPLGALVRPLQRYARGRGEFESPQPDACLRKLADVYSEARVDFLDGITVRHADWWFNVRKCGSGTQLSLTLEADTPELLQQKTDELTGYLGSSTGK
ncbi:MAG: phosphomannomutase/phosphoglucomutase [Planctomycetota bacterium]|jgi:phosphomannomutase